MSYEQPKYINESQADLFQNLQNTINESVLTSKKTIADQNYRNELYNNETILEGQNASANVISDVNKNQSGSQVTVGKTDQFFNSYTEDEDGNTISYAERAKQITMKLREKPKPSNYAELQAELDWIDRSPETMKDTITNVASQFNLDDIQNIDKTGNSDVLLAAMIFNEEPGYGDGNGFSYDFKPGKTPGTIDIVFKGEGVLPPGAKLAPTAERRAEIEKLLNEDPNREDAAELQEELDATGRKVSFKDGEYVLNSADLKMMNDKNKDLLRRVPSVTGQTGAVQQESGLFEGAEYDDNGVISNPGQFNISAGNMAQIRAGGPNAVATLENDETVGKLITTEMMDFDAGDGKTVKMQVWKVDKSNLRKGLQPAINNQVKLYLDPASGDVGRTISYWNNHIAPQMQNQTFDKDLAREAFGKFPEVARMEEGTAKDNYIKKKWQESMGAWGSDTNQLNKYQKALFHRYYTKQQVDAAYDEIMDPANARLRLVNANKSEDQTRTDELDRTFEEN